MAFIKNCDQCRFFRRPDWCDRKSRKVISRGEAILCEYYTQIGLVQIDSIGNLAGQLEAIQIPDGLISAAKLASDSVSTVKIQDNAVTAGKIADGAIGELDLADLSVTTQKLAGGAVTNDKVNATAGIVETKLNLDFSTAALNTAIGLRQLSSEKDQANGYLGLDAGAKVPLSKLNALTNSEIDPAAAIAESKLNLAYGTSTLNTDIQTREQSANKDVANGYLGLDAGAKVPLSKLNALTNSEIDAGAAIVESKLSLNYATHPQSHSLASHSTKAHSELTGVGANDHHNKIHAHDGVDGSGTVAHSDTTGRTANDHHAQSHSLASHSSKDHSELTNVLTSQHHVRYADSEAKSACVSDTAYGAGWNNVTDVAPSKNAVYDKIKAHEDDFDAHHLEKPVPSFAPFLQNGAVWNALYGEAVIQMPSSDSDCSFRTSIRIPDYYPSGSVKLWIMFTMSTTGGYSVKWTVTSLTTLDIWTTEGKNVLDESTAHDFPSYAANAVAIMSITLTDADIGPGKSLGIKCTSDASNTPELYIMQIWIEPT